MIFTYNEIDYILDEYPFGTDEQMLKKNTPSGYSLYTAGVPHPSLAGIDWQIYWFLMVPDSIAEAVIAEYDLVMV